MMWGAQGDNCPRCKWLLSLDCLPPRAPGLMVNRASLDFICQRCGWRFLTPATGEDVYLTALGWAASKAIKPIAWVFPVRPA